MDETPGIPVSISVVVPAHRRPESLAKCLAALAPRVQTLAPEHYEVIVSDDSPEADSLEPLIRRQFPWARWVQGPRRGPGANRNHGATHARGEWLAFTDDDCIPDPGWLQAFAEKTDVARTSGIAVLEGRTTAGPHRLSALAVAPVNETGNCLWSCNLALTRALFVKLGGFDPGFPCPHLEDVDLRLRLQDAAERWLFVPEAVVVHPPRPLRPIFQQIPGHESSFYLARKRSVSVASLGLTATGFLRVKLKELIGCRTFREFAIIGARNTTEIFLLGIWWVPLWSWRYRHGSLLARSARKRMVADDLSISNSTSAFR